VTDLGGVPGGRWQRGSRAGFRALMRLYRAALSPLLGPACRYEPTCSRYAEQAVDEWGLLRGVGLATWRVLRCHPFARGGLDPVPRRVPAMKTHPLRDASPEP
jgi:hypothetical protein